MKWLHLSDDQFTALFELVQVSSCALDQGESAVEVIAETSPRFRSPQQVHALLDAVMDKLGEQIQ